MAERRSDLTAAMGANGGREVDEGVQLLELAGANRGEHTLDREFAVGAAIPKHGSAGIIEMVKKRRTTQSLRTGSAVFNTQHLA